MVTPAPDASDGCLSSPADMRLATAIVADYRFQIWEPPMAGTAEATDSRSGDRPCRSLVSIVWAAEVAARRAGLLACKPRCSVDTQDREAGGAALRPRQLLPWSSRPAVPAVRRP
jgi:hypothetical protein